VRVPQAIVKKYYPPERYDGTRLFYDWVRSEVNFSSVVLNLGAGESVRAGGSFRGQVRRIVGADIDSAVLRNPDLDEAHVIEYGRLPFDDSSIDVAFSDYVFEHVEEPSQFLGEALRVLKRGGSCFFRTPNRFHYVSLLARSTPHYIHEAVCKRVHECQDIKAFRTFYRLNSQAAIQEAALEVGFSSVTLRMVECEPSYLMFNRAFFFFGMTYERLVNRFEALKDLRANIFGRLIK
jgi:SAM-dependent methyltransferase